MMASRADGDKGRGTLVTLVGELTTFVEAAAAAGTPLHVVERGILDRVLRMGHSATDLFLVCQGDGDLGPTVVDDEGRVLQRSPQPVKRLLQTVFGEHCIVSYVYAIEPRKKIELRPIDARLGLSAGKHSYLYEEFVQYFDVDQSFGKAAARFESVFGQRVSVDTLERINRRMGAQADAYLENLPTPPSQEEGDLLVATADGKGVPLVKADIPRVPAFDELERPGNRRMAIVGSVYSVDRYIRTPEQIVAALFREEPEIPWPKRPQPMFKQLIARFGRSEGEGAQRIEISGTFDTFAWIRQQVEQRRKPGQVVVQIMDGQRSLWDAAHTCMEDLELGAALVDILDIVHVSSYVWKAANVFETTKEGRTAFASTRLLRILKGDVGGVIASLRQMASKRNLDAVQRKQIATVCGYFENHRERMRYDEYLRAGYPIASGVIEGACRHLVKDRMERSGMRWTLESAQAMLNVRAVEASSFWQDFQAKRIAVEQPNIHPNIHAIAGYQPNAIAI